MTLDYRSSPRPSQLSLTVVFRPFKKRIATSKEVVNSVLLFHEKMLLNESLSNRFHQYPYEAESFIAGKFVLYTSCIHVHWCDITAIYKLSVRLEMKMVELSSLGSEVS